VEELLLGLAGLTLGLAALAALLLVLAFPQEAAEQPPSTLPAIGISGRNRSSSPCPSSSSPWP
jgi:hypothetical protein